MHNNPATPKIPEFLSFFAHSRTPSLSDLEPNTCHVAWERYCQHTGRDHGIDLSISNATRVGLPGVFPDKDRIFEAVTSSYEASPQGLNQTREAISRYYTPFGATPNPDDIQLFASTSEAVGALIKLVCQPGDEVITFNPTYPLLDCLCSLESVELREVALQDCAGEWAIDFWALEQTASTKTRAIIVVSPNNPTGHCIRKTEFDNLVAFCDQRGLILIVDEVFAGYRLDNDPELVTQPAAFYAKSGLVVSLSGLSKVCGLPQHKLGWGVFGGSPDIVREAMQRLSFITDSTLSVSGWVQRITPYLLTHHDDFSVPCNDRLRINIETLSGFAKRPDTLWTMTHVCGGWSACIRLPGWAGDDETYACELAKLGIRVFPGTFFGFRSSNPTLVLSLIVEPTLFAKGVSQLSDFLRMALKG